MNYLAAGHEISPTYHDFGGPIKRLFEILLVQALSTRKEHSVFLGHTPIFGGVDF